MAVVLYKFCILLASQAYNSFLFSPPQLFFEAYIFHSFDSCNLSQIPLLISVRVGNYPSPLHCSRLFQDLFCESFHGLNLGLSRIHLPIYACQLLKCLPYIFSYTHSGLFDSSGVVFHSNLHSRVYVLRIWENKHSIRTDYPYLHHLLKYRSNVIDIVIALFFQPSP